MARATAQIVQLDNWHDSKRHFVVGRLILKAGSYETEVGVGDLLLVTGEYRQVATIVSDTSLTVSNAFSNNANDTSPKVFQNGNVKTLTGSVDVTASASVVGVGTKFLGQCRIGDYLQIGTATVGECRKIIAITDDTHLTVDAAFTDLANDTSPGLVKAEDMQSISGSIDPAASTTVTGVDTLFLGDGIRFSFDGYPPIFATKPPVFFEARGNRGYLYKLMRQEERFTLTGTIDPAASTTVTGVGTKFTTELRVGDVILVSTERRFVVQINSDTECIVHTAFTDNANDTAPKRIRSDAATLLNSRLQIRGLAMVGSGTSTGKVIFLNSGVLTTEVTGDQCIGLPNLLTEAVPADVIADEIRFMAIFNMNSQSRG